MENENEESKNAEQLDNAAKTDEQKPQEGEAKADEQKQEPKEEQEGEGENAEDVKDRNGQPGINRDKYARDMAAKDDEIAQLRAQIGEAAKSEERAAELQQRINDLEQTIADSNLNFELTTAGCRNVKAAKALLEDYGNDVAKLKAGEPWLFMDEKKGATGFKPTGGDPNAAEVERVNKALGLRK